MTRLRWLDSTLAQDDDIVPPYTPLAVDKFTVRCLGRSLTIGRDGFPALIQSYFAPEMTRLQIQARSRDGRPDPAPGHRRGREGARLDAERHRSAGGPARSRDGRLGSRQLQRRLPHAGRSPHGIRRLRRVQGRRLRPERRVRRGHPARGALEPGGRRVHDGPRTQGRHPSRDVRLGLGPEEEPGRALDRIGQRRAPGRTAGRELFAAAQHEFLPVEAPEHAAVLVERRPGHGDRADGGTGPGRRQGPRRRHDRRVRGADDPPGRDPPLRLHPSPHPVQAPRPARPFQGALLPRLRAPRQDRRDRGQRRQRPPRQRRQSLHQLPLPARAPR